MLTRDRFAIQAYRAQITNTHLHTRKNKQRRAAAAKHYKSRGRAVSFSLHLFTRCAHERLNKDCFLGLEMFAEESSTKPLSLYFGVTARKCLFEKSDTMHLYLTSKQKVFTADPQDLDA